jgi:DNA end-binding protein Ku
LKHPKICPQHGEIEQDHVVSGYEYSKDEYIVVSPEELDGLRSEKDKTISIDRFVPPEIIDPIYHTGATYYVIPDGAVGTKPYAMLRRTMLDRGFMPSLALCFSAKSTLSYSGRCLSCWQ